MTAKQKSKTESEKRKQKRKGGKKKISEASKVQNDDGHCVRLKGRLLIWGMATSVESPF